MKKLLTFFKNIWKWFIGLFKKSDKKQPDTQTPTPELPVPNPTPKPQPEIDNSYSQYVKSELTQLDYIFVEYALGSEKDCGEHVVPCIDMCSGLGPFVFGVDFKTNGVSTCTFGRVVSSGGEIPGEDFKIVKPLFDTYDNVIFKLERCGLIYFNNQKVDYDAYHNFIMSITDKIEHVETKGDIDIYRFNGLVYVSVSKDGKISLSDEQTYNSTKRTITINYSGETTKSTPGSITIKSFPAFTSQAYLFDNNYEGTINHQMVEGCPNAGNKLDDCIEFNYYLDSNLQPHKIYYGDDKQLYCCVVSGTGLSDKPLHWSSQTYSQLGDKSGYIWV